MHTADPPAPPAEALCKHHRLCADGVALDSVPAKQALVGVLQALAQAEGNSGPARAASLCQAHTDLAHALSGLQAYGPAESHLAQALHWAVVMGPADTCADLHCALAELAINRADLSAARGGARTSVQHTRDRASGHALQAASLAGHTTDVYWEVKVLLRASDVLDRCGAHGDAVHLQHRALLLMGLYNRDTHDDALPVDACTIDAYQLTAPGQLM